MTEYNIRSKICYKPKKSSLFSKLFLNICLLIVIISGIVSIFVEGISIGTIGYMAIAYFIVGGFKSNPKYNEHYEFVLAHLVMDDENIIITYQPTENIGEQRYDISIESIKALEFSDVLCCLHIVADVVNMSGKNAVNSNEFYLYLEKGFENNIVEDIERISDIRVIYVDR